MGGILGIARRRRKPVLGGIPQFADFSSARPAREMPLPLTFEVRCGLRPGAQARRIERTVARQEPRGAATSTTSPTPAPMSADPRGESGETPPTGEIVTSITSPCSSATSTIEPGTDVVVGVVVDDDGGRGPARAASRCAPRACPARSSPRGTRSSRRGRRSSRAVAIASIAAARRGPSSSASSASRASICSLVSTSPDPLIAAEATGAGRALAAQPRRLRARPLRGGQCRLDTFARARVDTVSPAARVERARRRAAWAATRRAQTRRAVVATDLERFVEADGRAERVKEVRQRIDAEGVTYVYYQFISVTGRIMGKGVPAPHWETIAQKGFQLVYGSTANLFTDRHGNYIGYGAEACRARRHPGARDVRGAPVGQASVARVWCTCFRNREEREGPAAFLTSDCRGEPPADPGRVRAAHRPPPPRRHRARDDVAEDEGRRDSRRRRQVTKPYCYHIDQFSELQPIIHKMIEYGQELGPRHDPRRPRGRARADRAQLQLRPRGEDRRQPVDVPPDRQARSGASWARFPASCRSRSWASRRTAATTNISLWRARRTCSCRTPTIMQMPSHARARAIGGILEHLAALTCRHRVDGQLLSAASGTRASGHRCSADWGYQNRTTALRVSAPGRFEYRSVDPR